MFKIIRNVGGCEKLKKQCIKITCPYRQAKRYTLRFFAICIITSIDDCDFFCGCVPAATIKCDGDRYRTATAQKHITVKKHKSSNHIGYTNTPPS